MYINRAELKSRSRYLISNSRPSVIVAGLIYLGLSLIMYLLCLRLATMNYTLTKLQLYYDYLSSGNMEYAAMVQAEMQPPAYVSLVNIAVSFVMSVVGAGFILFLLNTIRNTGACYGNMLDGFSLFFKLLLLNLLTGIFILLWSLLLIVPGIIAEYRYRLAVYILLDNPEKSVMECIRESKRMMSGYKGELFILDLSFLGWSLLASLPIVGFFVQIWTVPYVSMTYALFYEKLSGRDIYAAFKQTSFPPPSGY